MIMKHGTLTRSVLIASVVLASAASRRARADAPVVSVRSPHARTRIEFLIKASEKGVAVPHYRVFYKDHLIVHDSRLAVEMAEGPSLGGSCTIESVQTSSRHASYTM